MHSLVAIGKWAFNCCYLLRSVKLLGVRVIGNGAFFFCRGLTEVKFGVELETIGENSFYNCTSLRNITMPTVTTIGRWAFNNCVQLTALDLPEGLERLLEFAFHSCQRLRRIAVPLNDNMIGAHVFARCPSLTTLDLVGRIHRTIDSLHLESWKNEMNEEINRVNQVLPDTEEKTAAIQQWMSSVISQLDYKAQHKALLKEATTLLELALWKANLHDNEGGVIEQEGVRTTRGQRKRARKEICVTSGASIVIKNVLPFLQLE